MIEGFGSKQQAEFICQNLGLDPPQELMNKIKDEKDLCSTPLNLCIFCLLHEGGKLKEINTRTELYQKLVDFLTLKASSSKPTEKTIPDEEQVDRAVQTEIRTKLLPYLYERACNCFRNGKVAFEESSEEAKKLCKAGFVTQEILMSEDFLA
jgi:hypothetical protein